MLIAFFVNAMEDEYPRFTTTLLAYEAARRGHQVCYITPGDFVLSPDDTMRVHAHFAEPLKSRKAPVRAAATKATKTASNKAAAKPSKRPVKPAPQDIGPVADPADLGAFLKTVQRSASVKMIDVMDIDVLMLRNDPSRDAQERPWAETIGIQFARLAAQKGVLVLNDPSSLSRAINKLYFQGFPREVRAETLITRFPADIKEFAKKHGGKVVLKPLQGSGGQGVFLVNQKAASNLNQMIEAISRDGYIIAQAYVPEADQGDIRFFLMNGEPLQVDGKYAAMRRVNSEGDMRSNIHAGGTAKPIKITERQLRVAELIRPKLKEDGMFLVGIDIIGDVILEVNVFSPGNLFSCCEMSGVNFAGTVLQSIERKLEIRDEFPGHFGNCSLAMM
ncbi:MAG: glutathione synthase [Pseudomonadota bacterium]|nr:glutathione synthase [Pseudomonadota bacterium]